MKIRAVLLPVLVAATLAGSPGAHGSGNVDALGHLEEILERSPAPEYRRFGSPGMEAVADYAATVLGDAGYAVVRHEFSLTRYEVDYSPASAPLLRRIADGRTFKVEATFNQTVAPANEDVTCVVALAPAGPGRCAFVPFTAHSPEWKNVPGQAGMGSEAVRQAEAAGATGVIIQGDVARDAVFATSARVSIPAVVAVADAADLLGQTVRLRSRGTTGPATVRNVIGVRRPADPADGYTLLLAHADGWFQAAADNGGGTAAVLDAAEQIASQAPDRGVMVAVVDAEEVGLRGSQRLAADLSSSAGLDVGDGGPPVRMSDLAAVVNLDASSARASEVQDPVAAAADTDAPLFSWRAMVFSEDAPELTARFLTTFARHEVLGLPIGSEPWRQILGGGTWRTDAQWFADAGVPAVWPVVGYPEYHTDADDLDAVNPADLQHVADAAADLVITG